MLHFQGSDIHKPKCKGVPDQRVPNLVPYFIPLLLAFTRPGIQVQLWFTGSAAQLHCQRVFPLHSVGQSTFTQGKKKMLRHKGSCEPCKSVRIQLPAAHLALNEPNSEEATT